MTVSRAEGVPEVCSVAEAARILHCAESTVRKHAKTGGLRTLRPVDLPRRPGRPPKGLIEMASVRELRRSQLDAIGASERTEFDALASRVRDLTGATAIANITGTGASDPTPSGGGDAALIDELRRRNAELEETTARYRGAMEAAVVAQRAILDEVQQLTFPAGASDIRRRG